MYSNLVGRTVAGELIPEEVSRDMIHRATDGSATMQLLRRIPVGRAQVLAALLLAYFINGDSGLKQSSGVSWTNKYLNIEEIALIIPCRTTWSRNLNSTSGTR